MNKFRLVKGVNTEVLREIQGWTNKIESYVWELFDGELKLIRGTQFADNIAKITYIAERVIIEPSSFMGVRDVQNRLQAGAIVEEDIDFLFLDAFASAPWNVLGNQPESIRGAGTSLMEELVKQSIDLGFVGRLKLYPIERARSFYRDIGFTQSEDWSGELELTPAAALRFLERQQQRRRNGQ